MERNVSNLEDEEYDLLIVGGGIYGAAAAREAALRGLSVALIERDDFGSGTSWNSFKTIHGGFRYLQKLSLPRVLSSIRERRRLLRLAPHLIRPLEFVLPTHGLGLRSQPALAAALTLYAAAGIGRNRGVRPDRYVSNGRLLGAKKLSAMLPDFDFSSASGAAAWSDAQMISSERVVLGMVRAAVEEGAKVANHVEALHWITLGPGRVRGVRAVDKLAGCELEIRARMVLNCAGPWAWNLLATDVRFPAPRQSRAANVVLRRSFSRECAIGMSVAGACPASGEQVLFMAPWRDRTILGTIHLPVHPEGEGANTAGPPEDAPGPVRAEVTAAEVSQLLAAINRCHPDLKLDLIYDLDSLISHQLEYSGVAKSKALLAFIRGCERHALSRSRAAITVCRALTEAAQELYFKTPIFQVEDTPLDEALRDPEPEQIEALRAQHALQDRRVVVYTGNLESYQGIDLLLEAAPLVRERVPEVAIVLVGGEATQVEAFRERVSERGLVGTVIAVGAQPPSSMPEWMALGEALVSPRSQGENTPLKIYTYMRAERPIVATNLETHTQVLDASCAVLCQPTANDFADGIARVLEDPEGYAEIARGARKRVESEYSFEAFGRKLLAAYESLD